jgi:hypothetical protein
VVRSTRFGHLYIYAIGGTLQQERSGASIGEAALEAWAVYQQHVSGPRCGWSGLSLKAAVPARPEVSRHHSNQKHFIGVRFRTDASARSVAMPQLIDCGRARQLARTAEQIL